MMLAEPLPPDKNSRDAAEMAADGFDAAFYRGCRPDLNGSDADLLHHYVYFGWKEQSQPHPLFDPAYVKWQWGEPLTEGDDPFGRYLAGRTVASTHPLFDVASYRARYPAAEGDLLQHYTAIGSREGVYPHPLFDPVYYRSQTIVADDEDPFRHYMMQGRSVMLCPHRLFDPAFYRAERPDVALSGAEPLGHYVQFGSAEGARPHPLFDPAYYRSQVPELMTEPVLDYLARGAAAGLSPHPLFDVPYYRSQLTRPLTGPDLLDYLDHAGTEAVSPCRLFDAAWYREVSLEGRALPGLWHYLREGWRQGHDPHPCFDGAAYMAHHPGLTRAPLLHYRVDGEAAGSRPNPLFSPVFYRAFQRGPAASGSAFEHYLTEGEAEGRAASPEFRPRRYASQWMAYQPASSPMRHYFLHGRAAGASVPPAPQGGVAAAFASGRPPDDGTPTPCVLILIGPADPEARAALGREIDLEAEGELRRCATGWVAALPDLAGLTALTVTLKTLPAMPVILLAGAVFMTQADISRLARVAGSGTAAHPVVLDRALDVYHAGFTVADGIATPRGVGADPAHPGLRVRDTHLTVGPVLALPGIAVLTRGGARTVPGLFLGLSGGAQLVPEVQALQMDAIVGGTPPPPVAARKAMPTPVLPRLLFIDSIVPRIGFDAGSYYALQLMTMFQGFGYRVTLIPDAELSGPPDAVAAVAAMGIEVIQAPFTPNTEAYINGAPDEFALIVMSRFNCGGRHLEALQARWPQARLLFHPGDLHHLRDMREAVLREDVGRFAEALLTKRRELAIVAQSDMTVVVSEHERAVLREAGFGAQVVCVEPAFSNRTPAPYRPMTRQGVAFIGGYGHLPNVDAVMYLCTEIWPLVSARRPDIVLHIVGSAPPEAFQDYASDQVRIRGRVEDLDGLLDGLRLTVAPLRYGAGVKMKLVSSLAAGVPAICTEIAAEGLGLGRGEGLVLAEGATAIADAVVRLYDDGPALSALSEAGHSAMTKRFLAEAVHAAYRDAVGPAMAARIAV